MDPLLAARAQMEVSLAFHMFFAALGIGLPLLMLIAEGLWLRTGREHYRELARTWAKATALTFAVGAVSGTALSFELGLLWPRFMEVAGSILGPAFALEGYAFFIEAIFLGLYLYGWDRLSPRAHWWTGVPVAISGLMSGILVVAANAWMQTPVGIDPAALASVPGTLAPTSALGPLVMADPFAVFRTPYWFHMALHSSLSCYIATGFAVAGVYAMGLLRGRRDAYHRAGLAIAMAVGGVTAMLQPLSGDVSARAVAELQPAKLAAAEAHFETGRGVPLTIGGIPTAEGEVKYAIRIPKGLSLLAHHDPDAEVLGLDAFPRDEWPNVLITHLAFQVMVGLGFALMGLSLWYWLAVWRHRRTSRRTSPIVTSQESRPGPFRPFLPGRLLLWAILLGAPMGFLALQAGWLVTEVGRQPWVIYGVMRTADAVTPVDGVPMTFFAFSVLYLILGTALVVLLRSLARHRHGPPAEPRPAEARHA
ncbi:MAG: cytochrome ubiquinol oxidase subunit I [Gemmatimonadetes bacterium]|nr:cytochrome ubiquinol oxidase subunit I [Gemmatimonadota bacterium]